MTQQKRFRLALSIVTLAAIVLVLALPFAVRPTANAAAPVVADRDTWVNTYTGTYYDNLNTDLRGTAFRSELADLITRTHTHKTTYDDMKTLYKQTDADPDKPGNIIWFYSGTSVPFSGSWDDYNSGYPTNREHVWPNQNGNAIPVKTDAGSDAHHIRPVNSKLNNTRGNHQFGEVTKSTNNRVLQQGNVVNYGTSDPDTWCYLSGNVFYPAKGYRGATARILFYLQTRWGDQSDLHFVLGEGFSKTIGDVEDLLKWNLEEPPTDQEIRRNNVVAGIQGNRNPFIDHPEYAEMIYCYDGESYNNALQNVVAQYGGYLNDNVPVTPPTSLSLSPSTITLNVGDSQQIQVVATPSDASASVEWSTTNNSVVTVNNGVVTAVGAGSATVTATSTADRSVSASAFVTVADVPLTSLTPSRSSLTLTKGSTQRLTVTAVPAGASNAVTWHSANTAVAQVDQSGLVTAVSDGETTVTATSQKNANIYVTITVKVVSQEQNIAEFRNAMAKIDSAATFSERYTALQQAIEAYVNMDDSAKSEVAAEAEILRAAVEEYNGKADGYQEEFVSATNFTSQALALGVSDVFLAIVVVLKKLLGR